MHSFGNGDDGILGMAADFNTTSVQRRSETLALWPCPPDSTADTFPIALEQKFQNERRPLPRSRRVRAFVHMHPAARVH